MEMAVAWCSAQGYEAVDEIIQTNAEAEFVGALGLKPGKHKLLLIKLQETKQGM